MVSEAEGRRLGVIAAVEQAQAAERRREERLSRAKTFREAAALERRFQIERSRDAQRIADLNQERLDFLRLSRRARCDPQPPGDRTARTRDLQAVHVRDVAFYRRIYGKLDSKIPPRHGILAPIPEVPLSSSRLVRRREDHLREKKALLVRLNALVAEEEAVLLDDRRPLSSASSSTASAATFPAETPRPVPRVPAVVPRLAL